MASSTDLQNLVSALCLSGISSIEAIPFVSGTSSSMNLHAVEVLQAASRYPGVTCAVSIDDVESAAFAIESGANEIRIAISASEIHNVKKRRRTVEESAYLARDILQVTKDRVFVDISVEAAFGCPIGGAVTEQEVLEIGDWLAHHGASRISLCDSAAKANPVQVERLCDGLPERWKELVLCLQFHNGRG